MKVAIILPTKGRAEQMFRNVTDMLMEIPPAGVELFLTLGVVWNDRATLGAARRITETWQDADDVTVGIVNRPIESTCVDGFNRCYNALSGWGDWLVLGSDDQIYKPGWLEAALKVADDTGAHVIGLNDGHTNIDDYAPHYMMRREFVEQHLGGYMVPPVYQSWWFDREICEKARSLGLYAPAWLAHVEHCHPDWGTADMDATYHGEWHKHDIDRATYEARRAQGYPVDYLETINA